MPTSTQKTPSTVDDYVDFFGLLAGLGIEFVVIGGCAVGAYARLLGEQVLSADLDLLVTWRSLETVVADAATIGARVQKLPQPRSVPVALLEWRGKEVNLLTGSSGLPTPDVAARAAREFHLGRGTDLAVLIADPFDLLRLLRNKLSVNRPKDHAQKCEQSRDASADAAHFQGQRFEHRPSLPLADLASIGRWAKRERPKPSYKRSGLAAARLHRSPTFAAGSRKRGRRCRDLLG